MTQAIDILKKYWDYHNFRPLQEDIIKNVLDKKNSFVLLPTGGGKSICYQIPALLQEGICLVISPLIALMKDQVQQLEQRGIKAIALDSSLNFQDLDRELNNCLYGNYKLLYMSPERLQSEFIQERLRQLPISFLAVDEAHCISQWGSDFRPAYANIKIIKKLFPDINTIALTGSATSKVINDIIENLELKETSVFKQSFKRENLAYMVFKTENKYERVCKILKKNPQPSIIYVRNRKKTKELSTYLNQLGFSTNYYHGGLTAKEKDQHFKSWFHGHSQVMVATNAFGMGIDKADVKTVIHLNLPENIENYYQEAGRAGRNGEKAFAILLYDDSDTTRLKNQFLNNLPSKNDLVFIYRKMCSFLGIAYQEGEGVTHDFNIYDFSQHYLLNINKVVNSLQFLDRQGVIRFTKNFKNQTKLKFLVDNYNLLRYINSHKHHNTIINCILRKYGGAFESNITIDINFLKHQLQIEKEDIIQQLKDLAKNNIIELQIFNSDISIGLLEPREDERTINRVAYYLQQQNDLKKEQIQSIINYINDTNSCKENYLISYFNEEVKSNCGVCSYCIKDKLEVTNEKSIQDKILSLTKNQTLSFQELQEQLNCSPPILLEKIRALIDVEKLRITPNQKYSS